MVYTFEETEEKTLVKKDGEVYLECYPGKLKTEGMAKDIGDAMVDRGGGTWSWDNNDVNFVRHLGYWAIKKARAALPFGALNQTMQDDAKKRVYLTPKKTIKGKECQLAPKRLASMAEGFFSDMAFNPKKLVDNPDDPQSSCPNQDHRDCTHKVPAPRSHVVAMAARDLGARLVGGGVCSLVSHVTMGFITQGAPPDTEAAIVYSNFDHSFCVVRYKTSPWMAVDPWVQRPYVVPLRNVLFHFGSLANNFRIVIKKKVDVAYGVTFGGTAGADNELRIPEAEWQAAVKRHGIIPHWTRNPTATPKPIDYDDKFWKPVTEVAAELADGGAKCDNWFHMSDTAERHYVWNHVDNLWWPRGKRRTEGCTAKTQGKYKVPRCHRDCCDHGDPDLTSGHLDNLAPPVDALSWGDPKAWKAPKTLGELLA